MSSPSTNCHTAGPSQSTVPLSHSWEQSVLCKQLTESRLRCEPQPLPHSQKTLDTATELSRPSPDRAQPERPPPDRAAPRPVHGNPLLMTALSLSVPQEAVQQMQGRV